MTMRRYSWLEYALIMVGALAWAMLCGAAFGFGAWWAFHR